MHYVSYERNRIIGESLHVQKKERKMRKRRKEEDEGYYHDIIIIIIIIIIPQRRVGLEKQTVPHLVRNSTHFLESRISLGLSC